MKIPLTVIILTFNEEKNLPKTLHSISGLADQIFIIDSFSTDRTTEIASYYNAVVYQNKFETHTKQWHFALNHLPITHNWILALDADQEITPDLSHEIQMLFKNNQLDSNGYYIKRQMFFLGKWIRYGGYYPRYLLKLFHRDKVYLDPGELMDHHFYVNGPTSRLEHDLIENNKNETLHFWLTKHIRYATLQAQEELNRTREYKSSNAKLFGNQDEKRQFLKNIWENLPLFIRPCLYFIYRYFIQLGFMDGRTGLIFHFLQAFWYRFTVDSLIYEANQNKQARATSQPKAI